MTIDLDLCAGWIGPWFYGKPIKPTFTTEAEATCQNQ